MSSTIRSDDPRPRTVGRYVLADLLGEGAAGEVWRATDPSIGRTVAVKLLKVPESLGAAQRAEWEQRFLLEARAAGRLSHPGIVSIHDVGTSADGRPFIVMELVEGRSLESSRRASTPLPLTQVVEWTAQVADALDAAHRRGVVHRDIKPANVLVDADGRARVADFGIARLPESEMTREGLFLGSPAFAAPEQIRGAPVDGRADLFSLGAVLYTLATGRRPFEGEDIGALAYAVCHVNPAPPRSLDPGIGPALEAVMLRALAKEPSGRFRTGAEMARALREALEPERAAETEKTQIASAAGSATVLVERARPARARTLLAVAGIVLAAVAVPILGRALLTKEEPPRRPGIMERLRSAGSSAARVRTVAEHRLEEGSLEVWLDGDSVLRERLAATRREPLGLSVLAYRKGQETSSFRAPPGEHELLVKVIGLEGVELSKTLNVSVEPKAAYLLAVSVGTWPRPKLGVDWDVDEHRGTP